MGKPNGNLKSRSSTEIIAVLGEKTEFKGLLTFMGTTRIDGKLEGEVVTEDTLIVGKTAHIKAEISAGTIITQGTIHGNLIASKKVEIMAGSKLIGNIQSPSLHIEEDAIFEGNCVMVKKNQESLKTEQDSPEIRRNSGQEVESAFIDDKSVS